MSGFAPPTLYTFPAATGRLQRGGIGVGAVGAFRLPTDPIFYASLTLANIIAGSRYRITRTSTGAELSTGLVAGSGHVDETITGIPAYSNPMQVTITVRNASGSPKYKVFDTAASLVAAGASAYILQNED